MRSRTLPLAAAALAAVTLSLACDVPVNPAPSAAPPVSEALESPPPDLPSAPSSLKRVELHAHSTLSPEQHRDLHVVEARKIEEESDARVLDAFRKAGASVELLKRIRRDQDESRKKDSEKLSALLTKVLAR